MQKILSPTKIIKLLEMMEKIKTVHVQEVFQGINENLNQLLTFVCSGTYLTLDSVLKSL